MDRTMSTLDQLLEISSRLEHLENAAEWVAKETIHTDNGISQTGSLMCVLIDEVREAIYKLAKDVDTLAEESETIH